MVDKINDTIQKFEFLKYVPERLKVRLLLQGDLNHLEK
jgi:hypothetical protein